jgi:hypothetical protein
MNIRIFNTTVLAIALFSAASSFAVILQTADTLSLFVKNKTDQDLIYEGPSGIGRVTFTIDPNNNKDIQTSDWSDNPDIRSPFTRVIETELSQLPYKAKITFLRDEYASLIQVKVDSPYTQIKRTFNIEGILGYEFEITVNENKEITVKLIAPAPPREISSSEEPIIERERGRLLGKPEIQEMIQKKQFEKVMPLLPRR